MSKKEDLEKIDNLVRKKMISLLESGETNQLPELNTVIQYLHKNNLVLEKQRTTEEDDIRNRVKEAEERRKKNVQS